MAEKLCRLADVERWESKSPAKAKAFWLQSDEEKTETGGKKKRKKRGAIIHLEKNKN